MSLLNQFKNGLARSKTGFINRLDALFSGGEINDDFYDELEEILVSGDVGVETTFEIVEQLQGEVKNLKIKESGQVRELLINKIIKKLSFNQAKESSVIKPHVIMLVGVNGSGKTTTAAKLARLYKEQEKKVLLVAGDTFRAAAVEQLEIWAKRAGVEIIKQQSGSDPSALYYDALNAACARGFDIVIGDTAGRLHNKYNLMEELNKIYRVVGRSVPGAPHEILLVIDATTGQNAVAQANSFNQALPLTGIVLTKLDGTARGGIVISIQDKIGIPVKYIGTGEKIDDLAPFDPEIFAQALLE